MNPKAIDRSRHSPESIDRIKDLLTKGWRTQDIVNECGVNRECVYFYRHKLTVESHGVVAKYDPASDKRVWERPTQSEAFAEAMAGRTFNTNVLTKSYGRQPTRNPTHVMAESNLALCG